MNKSVLTGVLVAAALAAAGLFVLQPDGQAADGAPAVPTQTDARADDVLPAISVVRARRDTVVSRLNLSGMIEAAEQVFVQPEIEGQAVAEIYVEIGDSVEAGQELLRLADDALQLQREQLEASAASAKANIAQYQAQIVEAKSAADEALRASERSAKLAQRGVVSQASLDQADAAATAARARLSAARQGLNAARAQAEVVRAQIANVDYRLARTRVTAPVAGLVAERNARLGAIATAAGLPMFVLIRDGALELRADVAEGDLARLAPGQSAVVQGPGGSAPIRGEVRLIEPTVNAQTRLGRVRIRLDPDAPVRAGMFADALVTVARTTGVTLPVSAVRRDADGARVLKVEDGRVERVDVVTGLSDERSIAIESGLSEGEAVVARAGAFVRPGERIRPVPVESGSAPSSPGQQAAAVAGGARPD